MNKESKESLHIAEHLLASHGHSAKLPPGLLEKLTFVVDGQLKIAVRKSALHRQTGPFFQFRVTNYKEVDFAILIGMMPDHSMRVYVIPKEALAMRLRIGLTYRNRYRQYIDAWGLIRTEDSCPINTPTEQDCVLCPKQELGWCKACRQWCYYHRFQFSEQ